MKVIILAAGRGSRMHEGTKNNPKCMMSVCGKSLIERCIDTLLLSNFNREDIGIVTGYKAEKIKEIIHGVTYFSNNVWDKTNMVYSLYMAKEWLESEDCIIVYSDIIFSSEVIKRISSIDYDIVLPYYTEYLDLWKKRFNDPLDDLETFSFNDRGFLTEIGNHPDSYDQISGQFMGIMKITPQGWNMLLDSLKFTSKTIESIDVTSLINGALRASTPIYCVRCSELWLECDNLNDVSVYETYYPEI